MSVSPTDATFEKQHNFKSIGGDDFVVFDNGKDDYSEVWRYRCDEASETLESTWNFAYGEQRSAFVLGDVHLLANDDYLISWGSEGEVTEVTPEGDVVWDVYTDPGQIVGFIGSAVNVGGSHR